MPRLTTSDYSNHVPPDNLLDHVNARYLSNPTVRYWLLDRAPHQLRHVETLHTAFSYACMYYPPTFVPKTYGCYPLPRPFLDLGDFLLCQKVHDGVALGSIYNPNEEHALSIIRDEMLRKSALSRRPCARNFAVDLRVPYLEIIEFAWMTDDSLIVACRRLHAAPDAPQKPLVLSADVAFFPPLDRAASPLDDVPLLRMNIREAVAVCQFCGVRGVHACACPPAFKTRAPPANVPYTPVPFNPAAFSTHNTQTTTSSAVAAAAAATARDKNRAPHDPTARQLTFEPDDLDGRLGAISNNNFNLDDDDISFRKTAFSIQQQQHQQQYQAATSGALLSWHNYAQRIFKCNQVGAFFVHWHRRNRAGTALEPFIKPRHPIPYQFVCGSKRDTLRLASLYIVKLRLCEKGLQAMDRRLRDKSPYLASAGPGDGNRNELTWGVDDRVRKPFGDESGSTDALAIGGGGSSGGSESYGYSHAGTTGTDTATVATTACDIGENTSGRGSPRAIADMSVITGGGLLVGIGDDTAEGQVDFAMVGGSTGHGVGGGAGEGEGSASMSSDMQRIGDGSNDGNCKSKKVVRTFEDRGDVESYMTLNENRTPTCRKCKRSFPKRGNLTRHVKIVHLGLRPFQCQVCGRRFGYKTHLKRHESGHARRHECACYLCSQPFHGWPALKKHMQSEHAQLEQTHLDLLRDERKTEDTV